MSAQLKVVGAPVQIAGLTAEQQLEALHRLWDDQLTIWEGVRETHTLRMRALSRENELLGGELRTIVAERDALLAAPSTLFKPRLVDGHARQAEREAFAAGLHHATVLQPRTAANKQAEAT
jgi:hypothetical protein